MKHFPHLTQNRHGVYYFRLIFTRAVRSIPNAPKELTLSLGTKDKSLALERYMRLYPLARALRGALHMDVQKGDPNVDEIKLSLTHWKETQRLKDALVSKEQTVSTLHRERLKQQGSIDSLAEENRQLKEQTQRLEGAVEELRMQQSRLVSEAVIPARPLSTAQPKYAPQQPVMTGKHAPSEHTLCDYVQRFLRYEDEHSVQSEKTREARENYLMRFLDIVGHELPLSELTPDRLRHYRDLLHRIPSNFDKQGFAIPQAVTERPAWFERTISEWTGKTLSGSGIDSHFKNVRVFLDWAKREHYLKDDLKSLLSVSKKRIKETQKEVVNFLPEDLEKLFIHGYLYGDKQAPRDNGHSWQFWVPLIALLTGMRSEEIGSLLLGSLINKDGFWCIQIEQSKTNAGERTFPIPQRLIDMGLLRYRETILEEHNGDSQLSLFPTLNKKGGEYSNRIGQFFNRNINGKLKSGEPRLEGYMFKCGIENPSDKETLKFHSLRHGFITKMLETKLPATQQPLPLDLIKNIVGHKTDFTKYGIAASSWNDVTHASYNHLERVSLQTQQERLSLMKEAMDVMDFGIDLREISYERFLARK
ncbi:tyrosine-type recombinase/integrase [Vibrio parahaemolyticus]|nr:tyrosine-type recombinase/integrase [Vibrio parahaemolyticus]